MKNRCKNKGLIRYMQQYFVIAYIYVTAKCLILKEFLNANRIGNLIGKADHINSFFQ
jgi:hypothetical protein